MNKNSVIYGGIVIVLIIIMIVQTIQISINHPVLINTDFRGIYTGGYILSKGADEDLYKIDSQYYWQQQFIPELKQIKYLMLYPYPPFIALLLLPLAYVPFSTAYIIWDIFNLLLLIVIGKLCVNIFRHDIDKKKLLYFNQYFVLFIVFTFAPVWVSLMQGQFSLILVLSMLAGWYFFSTKKSLKAGMSLSLLLIRPQLLIIPFGLFLFKRQWKALTGLLLGILLLLFIGTLATGLNGIKAYIDILFQALSFAGQYTVNPRSVFTTAGLLLYLYQTHNLEAIKIPLLVINGFIFILLLRIWKNFTIKAKPVFNIQWGSLVIVMILTNIHLNFHDLSLLIIPLLLLIQHYFQRVSVKTIKRYYQYFPVIFLLIIITQAILFLASLYFIFSSLFLLAILLFYEQKISKSVN